MKKHSCCLFIFAAFFLFGTYFYFTNHFFTKTDTVAYNIMENKGSNIYVKEAPTATTTAITASPTAITVSPTTIVTTLPSVTATVIPTVSPSPAATETPIPTSTPTATATSKITATPLVTVIPVNTSTVIGTSTPKPTGIVSTASPYPTGTNNPTVTAVPTPNMQNLINLTVAYTGPSITAPSIITKENLIVTAIYSSGAAQTVNDYTFLSSTYITTPGNYTITVFYSGFKASCTIIYDDGTLPAYYTITLESNDGSILPAITNITPNSTITYPDTPVYYGYRFRGWFTSPTFETEFSEYDKITSNITLYAKWEAKENPDADIFSSNAAYNNDLIIVKADLTGQNLGRYINLYTKTIETSLISALCKNVCSSTKYFGITLDLYDYTFSKNEPAFISISIPSSFDSSKVAVFYTTNNKTIAGKMNGTITHSNEQDIFSFYAYAPGNYIMVESDTIQDSETPSTTAPSAYIKMASLGKVKQYSQISPNIKLYNSTKNINTIAFIWSSSNTSVASVSKNGVISAISIGTATISVRSKDGTLSASGKITVTSENPITRLSLNASKKTLKKGKSFQIKAILKPKNATIKKLRYSSSKSSIAKVTSKGKIIARKKGSCIITVKTTDGTNIKKTIKITVKK